MGIALARERFKRRSAGVAKPQHARYLVERFACGIVPGAAKQREGTIVIHAHDVAVSAGGYKAHERRL